MKSLILYSTIVGAFYAQSEALDAAVLKARNHVGDDIWKRGYSGSDPTGATVSAKWYLSQAGIEPVTFDGVLSHIGYVENKDASGNSYPKLRIGVQNLDDQFLMSLDLKSDVAQRLLVKLTNCSLDDYIQISAWPTVVERDGRKFINHAASIKDADGKEVPADSQFSASVKAKTDAVATALMAAGISDKRVVSTAKTNKRVEEHKQLLLKIQARFVEATA